MTASQWEMNVVSNWNDTYFCGSYGGKCKYKECKTLLSSPKAVVVN